MCRCVAGNLNSGARGRGIPWKSLRFSGDARGLIGLMRLRRRGQLVEFISLLYHPSSLDIRRGSDSVSQPFDLFYISWIPRAFDTSVNGNEHYDLTGNRCRTVSIRRYDTPLQSLS